MEPFLQAVAQVGFPIAVAGYLLLRQEKTLKENAEKTETRLDSLEKSITGEDGVNVKLDKITSITTSIKRGMKRK